MKYLILLCALSLAVGAQAATKTNTPIDNLAGCFQVSYRFVEDGLNDTDIRGAYYEWIEASDIKGGVWFQHYGVEGTTATRHWGEGWTKQKSGAWKQTVLGPDGSLRYTCTAKLRFNQWRCTVYNAPKPVRDRNRTDYTTLDREITLQFTPVSWVQAQNDTKHDAKGVAVANEVGWNEYNRVDEVNCDPAKKLAGH
jgi:hypothetical protein